MTNECSPYSKNTLLTFFLPFISGGVIFSIIAINHVSTSPVSNLPEDYFYAVYSAFADIGTASGIAGIVLVSLFNKIKRPN